MFNIGVNSKLTFGKFEQRLFPALIVTEGHRPFFFLMKPARKDWGYYCHKIEFIAHETA